MKKVLTAIGIGASILAGPTLSALPASAASDSEITAKMWTFYNDYKSLEDCVKAGDENLNYMWRAYKCSWSDDGTMYQWDLYVDWL
jgi:hypothetical protein